MKKRSKFIVFFIVVIILAGIQVSNKMNNVVADDNNNDEIPSKYNIRDYIDLTVKNQYQNDLCIPTSNSTAIESYVKMRKLKGELNFITENPVFSIIAARQIGSSYIYVIPIENTEEVISEFYNGEITTEDELLRQQKVGDMDLDFELKKIQSKYQLIREDGRIGSLYSLGEINKSLQDNRMVYTDGSGKILSEEEINNIRNANKRYIMNNGAIQTSISTQGFAITENEVGDKFQVCKATNEDIINHSVVIIGWDDNFSRMNFPEDNRPNSDGAYIAQNSWGKSWGDDGMFYISYEDVHVESNMHGIYKIQEYVDVEAPKIECTKDNDGKYSIRISDSYGSGVKKSKYVWTKHNIEPSMESDDWEEFEDYKEIEDKSDKYLWIYAVDNAGNEVLESVKCDKSGLDYLTNEKIGRINIEKNRNENLIPTQLDAKDLCIISDTLSENDYEITVDEKNKGELKIFINKIGKHTLTISALIDVDGKKIETRAKKITVDITDETFRNRDKTKPEVDVEVIYKKNGKAKIIVTGTDEFGIDDILLVDGEKDGSMEECTIARKKAVEGKSEFLVRKNGLYIVYVYDTNGNRAAKGVMIDFIDESINDDDEEYEEENETDNSQVNENQKDEEKNDENNNVQENNFDMSQTNQDNKELKNSSTKTGDSGICKWIIFIGIALLIISKIRIRTTKKK